MTWPVRRGREAERPSFEQLVRSHLDAAYNLARWLVRDAHVADDVVQNALVRGLTYFDSFRGGDPRAWLLRIVRNAAYSELAARRQSLQRVETLDSVEGAKSFSIPDPGAGPERTLSDVQDAERLTELLATLPVELRECLVLKELEELSYKEIAQVTGVPIGTVMSRLWRARQMLMAAATGCGHEP